VADADNNLAIERADRPSSQRKIANIIAAARAEFFAHGFSASSIEAIAARAEVSKVTIYSWFDNKENLFGEVVKAECCHMNDNFVGENLDDKSLRDILIMAAENMLNFLMRDEMVRFERILASEVNRDPRIGEYFLDNGPRALLGNLIKLLQVAIKKGEIQSPDPQSSAEMFAALVMGRMDLMLRYGEKINLTAAEKHERATKAVDAWMLIHQK
jgi:TetR/AcrR family transcriptional repressor of mexJK operon